MRGDALQDRAVDVVCGAGDCFSVQGRRPYLDDPPVGWRILRALTGPVREDYFKDDLEVLGNLVSG
jgi:hypothetical protein